MATSVRIVFTGQPDIDDGITVVAQSKTFPFSLFNRTIRFKASRVNPGEATIGATLGDTIVNYAFAFDQDYSSSSEFMVLYEEDGVSISINPVNSPFDSITNVVIEGDFASYTPEPTPVYLTLNGLEGNYYLINNDIWLKFTVGHTSVTSIGLMIENQATGDQSVQFIVYPIGGEASVNISQIVKSLFNDPDNNHQNNFETLKINYYAITSEGQVASYSTIKKFIRGGIRTNEINNTLQVGELLSPTDKIPTWQGYTIYQYTLASDGIDQAVVDPSNAAPRVVKGCDSRMIRFLNQKGGYSYWLFELMKIDESNNNLGSINRIGGVIDVGNLYNAESQLYSKVHVDYFDIIRDLIISPDIYMLVGNTWERLSSDNNKITFDSTRKAYDVKLKMTVYNNLSPQL